jgi:hypothetical protein
MNWGAHKADVRIAAKNSVTMRAALRASINARAIYEAYQETHPFVTDNVAQDRTRARAWAMLHVKIDTEPIEAALKKIYTDGFLLGLDASKEAIGQEVRAHKAKNKAANSFKDELMDMAEGNGTDYVDWANWKPGNRAAALLFRPTGAFEKILSDAGITSKTIAKAGYDRIGTALSDSIAAGFSPARAAKVITEKIGDPARALTIAITEQNRAMSLASMENYKNYGVEKIQWSGANPCDICEPNDTQVVTTGQPFKNGDTEPPSHPNCRCAVLPVIDDEFFAEPNTTGVSDVLNTGATRAYQEFDNQDDWDRLSGYQIKDPAFQAFLGPKGGNRTPEFFALMNYKGSGYVQINNELRGIKTTTASQNLTAAELPVHIARIDKAMKVAPGLPEDIITFRGIKPDANLEATLLSLKSGDIFGEKGYSSTSMDKSTAHAGAFGGREGWQLTIQNPAGTKGVMLDGIIHGNAGYESEWLLPKNTHFEVVENNPATKQMTVKVVGQ